MSLGKKPLQITDWKKDREEFKTWSLEGKVLGLRSFTGFLQEMDPAEASPIPHLPT